MLDLIVNTLALTAALAVSLTLIHYMRGCNERDRQAKRDQMIKDNPVLQKAWEAIKKAEDNFDILTKFVESD